MVLVIDTSSARSALAVLDGARPVAEDVFESGREQELARRARALTSATALTSVVVALGPGSFTGLRLGVSYGIGLAMGLGVPLRGFGSLVLQAARARVPATALVEAGRGRVYWLERGGSEPGLGPPGALPAGLPAVGWLRPATTEALREAGIHLLEDWELDGFAAAAATLVPASRELSYGTVVLDYMQSFGSLRG